MFTQRQKDELITLVREFDEKYTTVTNRNKYRPFDPEQDLYMILAPLFDHDGYILDVVGSPRQGNVDYTALNKETHNLMGVEVKPDPNKADLAVRKMLDLIDEQGFEKGIVISLQGFGSDTFNHLENPVCVQMLNMEDIKTWVSRVEVEDKLDELPIEDMIKLVSQKFVEKIVKEPHLLMKLEWRDLERMVAELFEGLSFTVTLTPSAKDGGKDVILECFHKGTDQSYIIEIKHWRSQQRVGHENVQEFLSVICNEKRKSGLFLSTYGFADNAFEGLTEIDRSMIHFGDHDKIVSLCKSYMKVKSGLWSPLSDLDQILNSDTF